MDNFQIINEIRDTGKSIFYNPSAQLDYNYLAIHSLANKTYRGFHEMEKERPRCKRKSVLKSAINKIISV